MTTKTNNQMRLASWIAAATLAGSVGIASAQSLISYTFDSDVQGFSSHGGGGAYSWNATNGVGGGGCLAVTFDGAATMEMDPGVDVSLNTAQYFSVEFDLNIDPSSGTVTSGWNTGSYGAMQMVLRDAGNSWDSSWYGGIYASGYQHYKFIITRPYKSEAHFQIQLQGSGPYSGPVTAYLDNVKINPIPNPWIIDAFTAAGEVSAFAPQSWAMASATAVLATGQDAGGGFTPAGAMQLDIPWPVSAPWSAWGQAVYQDNLSFDPSRFTYLEMDVKVDAANSTLFSDGSYGYFEPIIADGGWTWRACIPAGVSIPASATNWTHVKLALPNITAANALVLKLSGNYQGPIRLFVDNIKGSNPLTLPKLAGLSAGGPGGTRITMDGSGDQWDREALCIPSGSASTVCTWGGLTPAIYSMSFTNFPSPADAPGFEAHIFVVNEDTIPSANVWNETYSGCDWNAADLGAFRVENGTNGGVVASFEWKTNSPSSNPTNKIALTLPSLGSANGTWSLNFSDDTHGSISGPGGAFTSFTLPDGMQAGFTAPGTSFLQVGAFKNDGANAGKSDNKSAIFTQILVTNKNGTVFSDDFSAGLTNNYVWRTTSALAINWLPQGTAYWLKWSVPDSGFTPQSAASMPGGWSDAGITYIYTDSTGTNRLGAVPIVSLPAGNAAFFRLVNTNQ